MSSQEQWTNALKGVSRYKVVRIFFDKKITDEGQKETLWRLWKKLNPEMQNPLEMAMEPSWWIVEKLDQKSFL